MREVLEETGMTIRNVRFAGVTNDIFREEGKHYITIFMLSDWESGEAINTEPDKCSEMGWFRWDSLPQPLFLPIMNIVKQGYNPFR